MNKELEGRVALVTGASRNIGRAIAVTLAEEGADIIVHVGSDTTAGMDTVAAVEATGRRATLLSANLGDPKEVKHCMSCALETYGRLDIVVNNAAIRPEARFSEIEYEVWRNVMTTNLDSVFLVSQAAIPALKNSDTAAIVNMGGLTAHTGAPHRAHVVASKAGIVGLTKAMAHDLSEYGITVNCVVPGMIDTERRAAAGGGEPLHRGGRKNLVGRRGTPREVAKAVAYLAGTGGRYVTGTSLHVNGGAFLP